MSPLLILGGLGALYLLSKGSGGPLASPTGGAGGAGSASLASRVASDIAAKGTGYDHGLLQQFQASAGIAVDGLYGPESAAALSRALGGMQVPAPIYSGAVPVPEQDPLTGTEDQEARTLAVDVEQDIRQHGSSYDHDKLKRFQALAHPIVPDGKYGPITAGALAYFLNRDPSQVPKPIYSGSGGNMTPVQYHPPT